MNDLQPDTPAALEPAFEPVDPQAVFDRDRFLMRQRILSVSQRYIIADEHGRDLIFVRRPTHIGRGVLAILAAFFAAILSCILGVLCIRAVELLIPQLSPPGSRGQDVLLWTAFVWMLFSFSVVPVAVLVWLRKKRHIHFSADQLETQPLLLVEQENKWQVPIAWYRVRTPDGLTLARLRKNYLHNIFRRQWTIFDPDGAPLARAIEDSVILSIGRRIFGPLFGALRTNFIIRTHDEGVSLGRFDRKITIRDRYVLDLTDDEALHLDRRVGVALAVLLDTAEKR